jgi:ectoine hydroxylase-related dioxygenase (phytanoyl-CoA dioxygenase family)
MITSAKANHQLTKNGFTILENLYTQEEIELIQRAIEQADNSDSVFRKTENLFAIRQFFKAVPNAFDLVMNEKLKSIVCNLFGDDFFVVKSIYFDKPQQSNWFVAYHQDLTISVDRKLSLEGFGPWTVKQNQFAVQPPVEMLEKGFTVRIHLDDTDQHNGALNVVPKSHVKGIYRSETIDWTTEEEISCVVPAGGIMIMKPLLLHSSARTTNGKRRRVIHIEFSNQVLPEGLNWSERRPGL